MLELDSYFCTFLYHELLRVEQGLEDLRQLRSKLDDIRGTPMDVGSLEEFIDELGAQTAMCFFWLATPKLKESLHSVHRDGTRVRQQTFACIVISLFLFFN